MGYFGNVSVITESTATVNLKGHNIITGKLKIAQHITDLAIGDLVICLFVSDDFQQGAIIAKVG